MRFSYSTAWSRASFHAAAISRAIAIKPPIAAPSPATPSRAGEILVMPSAASIAKSAMLASAGLICPSTFLTTFSPLRSKSISASLPCLISSVGTSGVSGVVGWA